MFFAILEMCFLMVLAALPGWFMGGTLGAALAAMLAVFAYALALVWKLERLDRWLSASALRLDPPWSGVWRDLSMRIQRLVRQQEKQATLHEKRLQDFLQAIQASPNGVVLLDEQARIEWCNNTAASHLGLDTQRDRMQHIVHLVRDPVFARYFSQADHDRDVQIEGRSESVSSSRRLSVQLHAYGEGRMLLLTRDVTLVAQADAMRRDFVANVSHEIRTPLTVLSGFVETLQSLPLDEQERQRYLSLMAVQSERMQTLVADLLTLSQLEGSSPPGLSEHVNLPQFMAQIESDAKALSSLMSGLDALRSQDIVFDPVPQVHVLGARHELHSAVANLVSNAVRYTPLDGSIHVGWTVQSDRWVLSVRDTGPGIAPEHLPRLSERFYRVDRSRSRETGGTGLGLAIAKHVAQRHGGELRIESQVGKGSTFMLVLPLNRFEHMDAVHGSVARARL